MDSTDKLIDLAGELVHSGEYRLAKRLFEVAMAERALRQEECGEFGEALASGLGRLEPQ